MGSVVRDLRRNFEMMTEQRKRKTQRRYSARRYSKKKEKDKERKWKSKSRNIQRSVEDVMSSTHCFLCTSSLKNKHFYHSCLERRRSNLVFQWPFSLQLLWCNTFTTPWHDFDNILFCLTDQSALSWYEDSSCKTHVLFLSQNKVSRNKDIQTVLSQKDCKAMN